MAAAETAATLEDIVETFQLLDDWEERYRYLIELGRDLQLLEQAAYNEANKVRGCASQVWLQTSATKGDRGAPVLYFRGDSDAHIVRGLLALIIALYSGKTASRILETDAQGLFDSLDLSAHLTPQRSNGVRAIIERIRQDARAAARSQPTPGIG